MLKKKFRVLFQEPTFEKHFPLSYAEYLVIISPIVV